MNKRKILGVGTVVTALILSVVAVTVAFAAYNSDLTINGSATAKSARWSVIFTDLQVAEKGNDNGMTSTAVEVTSPEIVGDVAIETYNVELKTPGDYVSYKFKISNSGDFPAKIDSSFAMPTPTCTKGTAGTDDDATNVCKNLEYTLKYVSTDASINGTDVRPGDTFDVGETKEVQLKLYYKKTVPTSELPSDDVKIGGLNITIPFVQY